MSDGHGHKELIDVVKTHSGTCGRRNRSLKDYKCSFKFRAMLHCFVILPDKIWIRSSSCYNNLYF